MPTPGVIAELHTDPLRDAPLRGKDANTLLLVVDKSAPQPGVASVHLVQPGNIQTLVEHHLVV